MAKVRRFENPIQLDTRDTKASLIDESKKAPDILFVALFNKEFPERGTIEGRLKNLRHQYEKNGDIKFYKYITTKGEQQIKTDFEIKRTPAIAFIRNGEIVRRLYDLEESNPAIANNTKEGEESNDEKKVKEVLDELCKKSDTADSATANSKQETA